MKKVIIAIDSFKGCLISAVAGSIEDLPQLNKTGFKSVFSITPGPVALEKAMEPEFAKENISKLVSQLYSLITSFD